MSVTIIGTVAYDSIKTPQGEHNKILGGSATFAGTAASIFTQTNLISIVGEDFKPEYLDYFKSRKINIEGIKIHPGKTFHWKGFYEKDMGQAHTIATDLNVLLEFEPQVPEAIKNTPYIYLGNIDPVQQKKALQQFTKPKLVVMDTMNYWITETNKELKETLKHIDVLIINDQELRMLTGLDNIIQAMPKALEMGPSTIIVKKGENGSIMYNGQTYAIFPAYPLAKLVDPTGAGDSFAGGFIGYVAAQDDLSFETFKRGIIAGTLMSSFKVQGFSVEPLAKIDKNKIQHRFEEMQKWINIPEKI
jgi:sugar/nucleoside kinase (ribokinase family)